VDGVTGAAEAEQLDEPVSFVEFCVLTRPRMCSVLRSLSGDDPRVEDVVQEALLIARHRWDRVGTYDRPDAWVIKVALRMLHRWRRHDSRASPLGDEEDETSADGAAGQAFERIERAVDLASALQTLPPARRSVVTLHYRLDLPVHQIADVLDIPLGTVKSHLHHGRRHLAALFADEEGTDR
jgi:RNA polymerase sigma-70 factor (ECF subfamily)